MEPIVFDLGVSCEQDTAFAFRAFRAAAGVSGPEWASYGNSPETWVEADNAAGRLIWVDDSGAARVGTPWSAAEILYAGAVVASMGLPARNLRAYYASSSGRVVVLLHAQGGTWRIAVARPGEEPRLGHTGESLLEDFPATTIRIGRAVVRLDDALRPIEVMTWLDSGKTRPLTCPPDLFVPDPGEMEACDAELADARASLGRVYSLIGSDPAVSCARSESYDRIVDVYEYAPGE